MLLVLFRMYSYNIYFTSCRFKNVKLNLILLKDPVQKTSFVRRDKNLKLEFLAQYKRSQLI